MSKRVTEMPPDSRIEARRAIGKSWVELRETYTRYLDTKLAVPAEVQADLLKYICIRMSGFLEQLIFLAITGYMREYLSGSARNFHSSWFYKAPNLNPEQFNALIQRFDEPWKSEFKDFLDEGVRRDVLANLLQIRNNVAHGKSYHGQARNAETYMRLVKDIYQWTAPRMLTDVSLEKRRPA